MDSLIKILGTYDLFVNLIPGIVFIGLAPETFQSLILINNAILLLAVAYFIGIIISRIGSIFLEWLFAKKMKFVKMAPYKEYLNAESYEKSKGEHKLDDLNRINNLYRSLASLCLCLIVTHCYYGYIGGLFFNSICVVERLVSVIFADNLIYWGLFMLFIWAYAKQTSYVRRRVENINLKENTK